MYIQRTIEKAILRMNKTFSVVLITGPRQVGKTTVFKCVEPNRQYISLDSLENRALAKENPALFLQRFQPPLLIDEIQYAPELLPYIKENVDKSEQSGMYWITGSQQFELMKGVSESLAGRVGILDLQGLSYPELSEHPCYEPFKPTPEWIGQRETQAKPLLFNDLYKLIWQGAYPALHAKTGMDWFDFYDSYVRTYIERDIRSLSNVADELKFKEFMSVLAARTGQILVYSDIARDINKPVSTVQRWISLLQTSGIIYILYPYANNVSSRVSKAPKIYFMDTGLACYLTKWNTAETLANGAMSGYMFETYVVAEIIKSYWHNGRRVNVYYYRDKDKREIDVLLQEDGKLYPVEIKQKSNPNKDDIKSFGVIESVLHQKCGNGAVICTAETYLPLNENVMIIPISYL